MSENYCLNVALDALLDLFQNGKIFFNPEKIMKESIILCPMPNKIIILYNNHKIKLFEKNGKWTILGVD